MATVEEVCRAMLDSDEERRAFAAALEAEGGPASYFAGRGCEAATPQELADCLARPQGVELADEELDDVAGGKMEAHEKQPEPEIPTLPVIPDCPECPHCHNRNATCTTFTWPGYGGETATIYTCNACHYPYQG